MSRSTLMMADYFRVAGQLPDFNTLAHSMRASANGLTTAATEMQKMSNIPIVDVAAQLNRMEERILRELRDLRAELTREYANFKAQSTYGKTFTPTL